MKVLKFGGSSLANSKCMQNVLEIIKQCTKEKIVLVLSACQNVTNNLINAAHLAKDKNINLAISITQEIRQSHLDILKNIIINNKSVLEAATNDILNLCLELDSLVEGIYLLNELTPLVQDKVYSFGEILSSKVFYYLSINAGLNTCWFDARNIIITDSNFGDANPLQENINTTSELLLSELQSYDLVITQGFIGSDLLRRTTTLGRGGSDFSAALIGAAIKSDVIEIWTDVDGVLSADPKIVLEDTISIPQMSYSEIKDLSFYGAKVLHPKSILPAIEQKIPVKILNSLNPKSIGTTILPDPNNSNFLNSKEIKLHSIISKNNCFLIEIDTVESYIHVSPFINSLQLLLRETESQLIYSSYSNQKLISLVSGGASLSVKKINSLQPPNAIKTLDNLSAVCITGENFTGYSDGFGEILHDITKCFRHLGYEISQLLYLFSKTSLIFLINAETTNDIINLIHKEVILKYSKHI